MSVDKKILQEIQRIKNINRYIVLCQKNSTTKKQYKK